MPTDSAADKSDAALLATSLASSVLAECGEALDMLGQLGVRVTRRAQGLRAADLQHAYERRWRHLDTFESDFATRLRFALSELIARLRRHRWELVDMLEIHGTREEYFLAFTLCSGGVVIGCLPMVDRLRIAPERWRQIWETVE